MSPLPGGMIGRTGLWMRQVVGFRDRSMGRVIWEANMGRPIVNNGDFLLLGIPNRGAARLLLGEFLELQTHRAGEACRVRPSARCS